MSDKKFNDETSKVIWNKLKGKDVPENYSDKDKEEIRILSKNKSPKRKKEEKKEE